MIKKASTKKSSVKKVLRASSKGKTLGRKAVAMNGELYFLKYAYPCAFIKLQQGRITEKQYKDLGLQARGKLKISGNKLFDYFGLALGHIAEIALEKGVDAWSIEAIREYFWYKHDDVIEAGEGFYADAPKFLCDLCRVRRAKVIEVGSRYAVVLIGKRRRSVVTELVSRLKVGDDVMVHYGYAVEKV